LSGGALARPHQAALGRASLRAGVCKSASAARKVFHRKQKSGQSDQIREKPVFTALLSSHCVRCGRCCAAKVLNALEILAQNLGKIISLTASHYAQINPPLRHQNAQLVQLEALWDDLLLPSKKLI
jgi:hypothetical protein